MKIYQSRDGQKNIENRRKSAREWARRNPKPYSWDDTRRETQRRYRLKHKEKIAIKRRERFHERLNSDIQFHLTWLLRARIQIAIKRQLGNKALKTLELLGCSIQEAREHIEKQFKNGMSWDNHGDLWEIDHIVCVATFDLTNPEEQKRCFHYTNLQPLIKMENRQKQPKRRMIV